MVTRRLRLAIQILVGGGSLFVGISAWDDYGHIAWPGAPPPGWQQYVDCADSPSELDRLICSRKNDAYGQNEAYRQALESAYSWRKAVTIRATEEELGVVVVGLALWVLAPLADPRERGR